jgi:Outer membrane protein beta-barrel domain
MKTNHCSSALTAFAIVAATSLHAADDTSTNSAFASNDQGPNYEQTDYYHANELSVDAFGTAAIGQYTVDHLGSMSLHSIRQNTQWGAGAGVNYFVTRYLGIGAEADSHDTTGIFIDNASANLMLRLPLGNSGVAPYILGGGGHQFDDGKYWFGQGGGGLEYRFMKHVGLFADARVVWPNETKAYGAVRAGLRFSF